jgi:hypothetical protein
MTPNHDDTPELPSAFDLDEAQFEQFTAELERIFGPSPDGDDPDRPSRKMMWVLPAPTFEEAMALLHEVPSGSGEAGLNALLMEHFPALAEAEEDDPWSDPPASRDGDGSQG